MADPTTQKPALPSTPTVPERRVLCNHTTMERVFNSPEKPVTCQLCDEADFGWIYVCTEDQTRGAAGITTTGKATSDAPCTTNGEDDQTTQLNDWVLRAIEDGHYTDDQIKILQAQRSNVRDTIAKNYQPQLPKQEEEEDDACSSATPDEDAMDTLISEQQRADFLTVQLKHFLGLLRADEETSTTTATGSLATTTATATTTTTTTCQLRLCHYCFPSGKDRTWLSLNELCADPGSVAVSPGDIFEIPSAEVPRLRIHSCVECESGVAEANNDVSIESILAGNNEAVVDDDVVDDASQSGLWPNNTPTPETQSDRSARELLEAAFSNYKRQQLGTPRKVCRRRRNAFAANTDENSPPGPTRPRLTRKPRLTSGVDGKHDEEDGRTWCDESEISGLEDTDIATQV